jgi:hypothetical protein
MLHRKYSFIIISLLLLLGFSVTKSLSENLIESILLQTIPEEIKDVPCPLYITLQTQIKTGTNIYRSDLLAVKYRLIGDNGYSSNWRQFSLPKGEATTDVFRRKIDPAAIAEKSDFQNNPTLRIDDDTAYYKGWSVLELIYQDRYRKVHKKYSNNAQFDIECSVIPST